MSGPKRLSASETASSAIVPAPEVSVIIPAYNREHYINEAIASVLEQQTDFAFEVIVSDDGSTDRTVEVVRSYGDRVRVIGDGCNRGAASARNAGIREASASLIAFLDSDDVMLPGRLQVQAEFLQRHANVGVVTAACEHEMGDTASEYFARRGLSIPKDEWLILDAPRSAVIRGFLGNQSATTIRKALLEEVGYYNTELVTLEDWDLMYRLAARTKFACYNAPVAWIRTSHHGRLGCSMAGAIAAPEVWRAMRDSSPNLSFSERAMFDERYRESIRGALNAALFDEGGAEARKVLARYGRDMDARSRVKWKLASSLPSTVVRRAIRLKRRVG